MASELPTGITANSNGSEAVVPGKRTIIASKKLIENIRDGETHRGANGIFGDRDIEVVPQLPKRKATVEDSDSDSEDEGSHEKDPGAETVSNSESEAVHAAESSTAKVNRKQARKLQRDLKKAAKGGVSGRGGKQKSARKGSARKQDQPLPASTSNADECDVNGILKDLSHIVDLSDSCDEAEKPKLLSASADVRYFFNNLHDRRDGEGRLRRVHDCRLCKEHRKVKYEYVVDLTTSRRHLQSEHKGTYRGWAKLNKFTSMLPEDTQQRRKDKVESTATPVQSSLDDHAKPIERPLPYSDDEFKRVAIEWLVSTDQALHAFEHEKFKAMIEVASRAKNGVKIPSGKVTRAEIIKVWYAHLRDLKKRLNSDAVKGRISLTCDGWQASNVDAYFAVTAHWVEEGVNGAWQLQSALIGFTRLNSAHSGLRLGQALFKIISRVGIVHKVGHVSCDNASNNGSMMDEFARLVQKETGRPYDAKDNRIRCLAHVINLATQALIRTYSLSKHYDPHNPEDHMPPEGVRDEIGLVRATCVKERSSAKRKELFLKIQADANAALPDAARPLSLLLDMPVRWSSTYTMLVRAYKLRNYVDEFVLKMFWTEKNTAAKSKLERLRLSPEEWKRVKMFTSLLAFADDAQQEFSSDQYPSLSLAIPALEGLHRAWSRCHDDERYAAFRPALAAALDTIKKYYDLTSESNAYLVAMVLDPCEKMCHFEQNWADDLQSSVVERVKKIFRERYVEVYGDADTAPQQKSGGRRSKKIRRLVDLSDDECETMSMHSTASLDPTTVNMPAWEREYNKYINSEFDDIPHDMSLVHWWGINAHRYPVWASLARDYLAIMASSVSSERAFSSAGITITKRRNRLKADVVEALQGLKCALKKNLLVRESGPSSIFEAQLEAAEDAEDDLTASAVTMAMLTDDNSIVLELELDSDAEEED